MRACGPQSSSLNNKSLFIFQILEFKNSKSCFYTFHTFSISKSIPTFIFQIDSVYDFRFQIHDFQIHDFTVDILESVSLNKRHSQQIPLRCKRSTQPWATPRGAGLRPAARGVPLWTIGDTQSLYFLFIFQNSIFTLFTPYNFFHFQIVSRICFLDTIHFRFQI